MNQRQKQALFDWFDSFHDVMMLESDMHEIENIVLDSGSPRWVDRNERLPAKSDAYFVKWKHNKRVAYFWVERGDFELDDGSVTSAIEYWLEE